MSKIGLIFPGQGSQCVGMGKELIAASSAAKAIYAKADAVLGFSLTQVMLAGPEEELKQTEIAQPAILTASVAALRALQEKWQINAGQVICAGHSLGEYSALCAAGALDFESALRLVRKRGQLMQEAAKASTGSMAAVIGKSEAEVQELCQLVHSAGQVQIANLNCPGQIVVSGSRQALEALDNYAQEQKIRVIPLTVSGPFHSRFMQPAADQLAQDLKTAPFKNAEFPVIANVTAEVVIAAQEIRARLLEQVTGSVRWEQSMQKMQALGVKQMIEIGPGKVLRGLMKKINKEVKVWSAFAPEEITVVVNELTGVQIA
ncbi:ACP S-malonyltransferase [bacterium]|nr:ACP S-malonyltransferase [bacterium]